MKRFFTTAALSLAFSLLMTSFVLEWSKGATVPIAGNFLRIVVAKNTGIAFSIQIPSPWQNILIAVALAGICIAIIRSKQTHISSLAFGMIIGGAFANLFDRMWYGAVIDFISVGTFPIFNIADAFISIGAGLLIVEGYIHRKITSR